jgi:hypothetical protein
MIMTSTWHEKKTCTDSAVDFHGRKPIVKSSCPVTVWNTVLWIHNVALDWQESHCHAPMGMVPSAVATSAYSLWSGRGFESCRKVIYHHKYYLFISLILRSLHHWEGAEVGYLVRSCKCSHKRLTCIIRSIFFCHASSQTKFSLDKAQSNKM